MKQLQNKHVFVKRCMETKKQRMQVNEEIIQRLEAWLLDNKEQNNDDIWDVNGNSQEDDDCKNAI